MSFQSKREIFLSNSNIAELHHICSYSEKHHLFHITIMGIKYIVVHIDGDIFSVAYHDDYINCFAPLKSFNYISKYTLNKITEVITTYFNENKWLQGWTDNWMELYYEYWNNKMIKEPDNSKFNYIEYTDSFTYFISDNNTFEPIKFNTAQ